MLATVSRRRLILVALATLVDPRVVRAQPARKQGTGFPRLSCDGQRLAYIAFPVPPERGPGLWTAR